MVLNIFTRIVLQTIVRSNLIDARKILVSLFITEIKWIIIQIITRVNANLVNIQIFQAKFSTSNRIAFCYIYIYM